MKACVFFLPMFRLRPSSIPKVVGHRKVLNSCCSFWRMLRVMRNTRYVDNKSRCIQLMTSAQGRNSDTWCLLNRVWSDVCSLIDKKKTHQKPENQLYCAFYFEGWGLCISAGFVYEILTRIVSYYKFFSQ